MATITHNSHRRLLARTARGLLSLALLISFVVGLATFPPLRVVRETETTDALHVEADLQQWQRNLTAYWQQLTHTAAGAAAGAEAGTPVWTGLGRSLTLVGLALTLAVLLGVPKGLWDFAQLRRPTLATGPILTGALQGLPDFWVCLVLLYLSGWAWRTFDVSLFKSAYDPTAPAASLILPAIALSLIPLAHIARITASAMVEVYGQDYIRTARAKGLRPSAVIFKHALRNAAVQMLDGMVSVVAVLFSNLVIVEYLFQYPGLTPLLREAVDLTRTGNLSAQMYGVIKQGANAPVLVQGGIALGLTFSLLYLSISLLRTLADPRLKERDQA